MSERARLNVSTGDLDEARLLADAQRGLHEISSRLLNTTYGRKIDERRAIGRKLNAVAASIRTVEIALGERMGEP